LEDVDELTAADFMGRVKVDLNPLKDHTRQRHWHPLQADAEGTGDKASSNVIGSVELVVQWRYNAALRFAPFDDAVDHQPADKKPNELRVAAIQGRRLAVKDKKFMGKGGSSDPVLRFECGSLKFETTVKKKTLNPTWQEAFAKPCSVEDAGDAPTLKITCEDWDELTSRDFMGDASIDLAPFLADPHAKAKREWVLLDLDSDKSKTENVSGEGEIWYQWRWNPALEFEPFSEEHVDASKQPNVLRIGLGAGRGLAVKDKALLYGAGSSDPRCVFTLEKGGKVMGGPVKSATQKKTLDPSWREVLELETEDAEMTLKCVWEDVDEISAADFMGSFAVALKDLPDQKVVRKWYPLENGDGASENISGEIELVLQWARGAA